MEAQHETPFFDAADLTALVCIDQQQYQKLVVPQLIDIGYKVHLGLFEDDVLVKLRTYRYNVVVVHENFKGHKPEKNPLIAHIMRESGAQRREHFVVLLSQRFPTNDAMSAFVQSVDMVLNVSDLANLKPILRRGVAQHRELYQPFQETLKAVQAM